MAHERATISDAEWDLLDALWGLDSATASDVVEALKPRRGWARTTVKTLLDRMVKKGLVEARRVGPVVEYRPALAPDEARLTAWRRFVWAAFGGSLSPALEFIARGAKLTRKEREALRRLLEESEHG